MLKLQDSNLVVRENMLLLAGFLEKNEKALSFDMRDWVKPPPDQIDVEVTSFDVANKNVCGTAACAIGWARFVVNPLQEHYYPVTHLYGPQTLNFNQYSTIFIRRFLTNLQKDGIDGNLDVYYKASGLVIVTKIHTAGQSLFDFCFGHEWSGKDNSILGAVFRIHYVLDNPNTIPVDWIRGADMEGYNQAKYDWLKQRGYSL